MWLLHRRWFLIGLSLVLLCVSLGLVARKLSSGTRHTEVREAFILLQTGGYTNEARTLYNYLLLNLHRLPSKELIDDWQRTVMLVNPSANLPDNLIWRYHWTVRHEMEKRAASSIQRARELAATLQREGEDRRPTHQPSAGATTNAP